MQMCKCENNEIESGVANPKLLHSQIITLSLLQLHTLRTLDLTGRL
jgi:hypothetical protein